MRISSLVVLALCSLTGVAAADTVIDWDGTYTVDGESGRSDLCAYFPKGATITVTHGTFSTAWMMRDANDQFVRVGKIEGAVRPSGLSTARATLLDPLPGKVVAALEGIEQTPAKLRAAAQVTKVRFDSHEGRNRVLAIISDNCSADFTASAAPEKPAAVAPAPDPSTFATAKPAVSHKPPPPLPAGSSAWDMTYVHYSGGSSDEWRCPRHDMSKKLVVSSGRFSIPWIVSARTGDMTVGQIDGSVAANGKVNLRLWVSYSELPPELADGNPPEQATLDYLRSLKLTATFKLNKGKERYLTLTTGGVSCELEFMDKHTYDTPPPPAHHDRDLRKGATCTRDRQCESNYCTDSGVCR